MDTGHFDGACEPRNPGGAMGWGWTLDGDDGWHIEGKGYQAAHPANTNNVAEYAALLALLTAYVDSKREGPLHIMGDSMLVVNQVNGTWSCNAPHLQALHDQARTLLGDFLSPIVSEMGIKHVPREQNSAADALSVAALEEHGIQRTVR